MKINLKVLSTFLIIILVLQFKSTPVNAIQCSPTNNCGCETNADCNNHGTCYIPNGSISGCQCGQDANGNYYGGKTCDQIVCDCTCNGPNNFCLTNDSDLGPAGCLEDNNPPPMPYIPNPECNLPERTSFRGNKQSEKLLDKELTGTWLGEIPSPATTGSNEQLVLKLCIKGQNNIEATANSPSLFKDAKYDSSEIANAENTFTLSLKNNTGTVIEILVRLTEEKKLSVLLHDGRAFTMEKIDKFKDCGLGKRKS